MVVNGEVVIRKDAKLTILRVPLCRIHVMYHAVRFPETLLKYIAILLENPDCDVEVLHLRRSMLHADMYALENGYHKYCAAIMAGKQDVLCVLEE